MKVSHILVGWLPQGMNWSFWWNLTPAKGIYHLKIQSHPVTHLVKNPSMAYHHSWQNSVSLARFRWFHDYAQPSYPGWFALVSCQAIKPWPHALYLASWVLFLLLTQAGLPVPWFLLEHSAMLYYFQPSGLTKMLWSQSLELLQPVTNSYDTHLYLWGHAKSSCWLPCLAISHKVELHGMAKVGRGKVRR